MCFVFEQVFVEGLQGSGLSSSLILHERNKAPACRSHPIPCTIIIQLAGMDDLSIPGKRPVGFTVTNACLGRPVQEIEIGNIDINAILAHPTIEIGYLMELIPLGIFQPFMIGMVGRCAYVAGIGAVVLEATHARTLEEGSYMMKILISPIAAKAGSATETHPPSFTCLGIDNIYLVADPTA